MKIKKSSIIIAALVIGVIIIPLAYSIFYLGAFWDPYSRLSTLPVAVVNEDKGAEINGETRNFGNDMVDKLKDNDSLKWVFTDSQDASDGLKGTDYYAVITIPEDFSADIASAETNDKQIASISYSSNEKRNFLASQIIGRAILELEEETRSEINKEITKELISKLKEVPTQMQDLNIGLGAIYDGTVKLSNGLNDLSGGQDTLLTGINSLDSGLAKLSAGAKQLSANIDALHAGILQAKNGTQQLLDAIKGNAPGLSALSEGTDKLKNGAAALSSGLSTASTGAQAISDAAATGLPDLKDGINQLDTGAAAVSQGTSAYVAGVNSLISQNIQLSTQLASIYSSTTMTDSQKVAALGKLLSSITSKESQANLSALSAAGTTLTSGASQLAEGADTLKAAGSSLDTLQKNLQVLSSSLQQLNGGAAQLSVGTSELAEKTQSFSALTSGLTSLVGGLDKVETGSKQLYDGSQSLAGGIASAKSGISELASGGTELKSGTSQLVDAMTALSDGVKTADESVSAAVTGAPDQLKAVEGLDTYAAKSVIIKEEPLNPVPNYGTAFAPYFMSLSLYVGALIIFVGIFIDKDEKIKTLSQGSKRKFLRVGIFALIGVAQALILALLLKYALHLTIVNNTAYYMSCILVSMVFISIVEFFFVYLKDLGKFLSMMLLILQLTSCAGTFPVETVPKFFRVLYPFMPMTYSVKLFKEAISGYNNATAMNSVLVLVLIFAAFTGLTMLFSIGKKAKEKRELAQVNT